MTELLDPEDEPKAMMIILGMLYGTDVQVPKEVDLPMMDKISVLVDKYQWHALAAPHAISWFDRLVETRGLPDSFDETLLILLWITWLFGMKHHFKTLSRVAQQDASKPIDLTDEKIRLPTRILEAINEKRQAAFQKVEQEVEAFKDRLLKAQKEPEPEMEMLSCMAFGFAIFCSKDLKLAAFSAPDHSGSSIRSLKIGIDSSDSMEGFLVQSPNGDGGCIIPGRNNDLKSELQRAIRDLQMDGWGLNYDDFKPPHVDSWQDRVLDMVLDLE